MLAQTSSVCVSIRAFQHAAAARPHCRANVRRSVNSAQSLRRVRISSTHSTLAHVQVSSMGHVSPHSSGTEAAPSRRYPDSVARKTDDAHNL